MQISLMGIHQDVQKEAYSAEIVVSEDDVTVTIIVFLPKEEACRILDAQWVVKHYLSVLDPMAEKLGHVSYPVDVPRHESCCDET